MPVAAQGECSRLTRRHSPSQDQPLLSSSLQTAHNLSVLPSLIESLIGDLGDLVARKVKNAFDLAALAREVGGKGETGLKSLAKLRSQLLASDD